MKGSGAAERVSATGEKIGEEGIVDLTFCQEEIDRSEADSFGRCI